MRGKNSPENTHCKEIQLMMEYKSISRLYSPRMPGSQFERVLNRTRMSTKRGKNSPENTHCKEFQLMMEYKSIPMRGSPKMSGSQFE
jgi:hypothetical protein